jgi:hypothetical protein
MSSTLFEPEGLTSGRLLYIQVWYGTLVRSEHTLLPTRPLIPIHVQHTLNIPVYTNVFLKMNPRVRNMQKTSKIKYSNINLEKVHFVAY